MIAVKMAVFVHVGTVAGGGAVQVDLPDQTALNQGVQTVVNRCHGDIRQTLPGAPINLVGGGVVSLLKQDLVNMTPLRREPKAIVGHPPIALQTGHHIINITHNSI
jgi:hypothetical protein